MKRNEKNWPWKEDNQVEDLTCGWYVVYRDLFPVTKGHLLFVPREVSGECLNEAFKMAILHGSLMISSGTWDGFNVGMNIGGAAGQTIEWPHIHLIPRYIGDVVNPTGGIRNVIYDKGDWLTSSYFQSTRRKLGLGEFSDHSK